MIPSIIFVSGGGIERVYSLTLTIDRPSALSGQGMDCIPSPVVRVVDSETGLVVIEIFRYGGETIVYPINQPEMAAQNTHTPVPPEVPEDFPVPVVQSPWQEIEKEIQREIGRFTEGSVDVRMISDTKASVYIEDRDIPAAIGKGGKNIASIVNKVGVGIDIRSRTELDTTHPTETIEEPTVPSPPTGGVTIRTDKKYLILACPEHASKIVDVFSGKEYLFTGTVEESGEILLARNNSIAQEMLKRDAEGEKITVRPVE